MKLVVVLMLALAWPARAAAQDPLCLTAPAPPITKPARPLRFGITPLTAGSAGGTQGTSAADDPKKTLAALHGLQPKHRRLVIRLNRMFEADGRAGVERFAALARHFGRAGFDVEAQVRYHPTPEQEGDMQAWERYVRMAARILGRDPAVVELSITNEVNLPISANTSDGAFKNAIDAIVDGVPAARQALDRIGRQDVAVGFTYAYRWTDDLGFWQRVGAAATPAFRSALDHVGVQAYPGLFWPPVLLPNQTAGSATVEALTLVRNCFMPLAGLGPKVHLWVTENGYATNLGHDAAAQAAQLRDTVGQVHAVSGTLGVTDYRYFNLRDNDSDGTDLFAAVGLLDDRYAPKPAYRTYRGLIKDVGAVRSSQRRTVDRPPGG